MLPEPGLYSIRLFQSGKVQQQKIQERLKMGKELCNFRCHTAIKCPWLRQKSFLLLISYKFDFASPSDSTK